MSVSPSCSVILLLWVVFSYAYFVFHLNRIIDLFIQARIKTAKRRVVMASLYLGTGPLEQDLVCFHVVPVVQVKVELLIGVA